LTRHRIFLGVIAAVIAALLALAVASPQQTGYWIALAALIWWAAPYFGATSLAAMVARHAVLFAAILGGIPFAISSPHHLAFWVLLGALVFVLAPFLGAMAWFYGDIRRLLRERTQASDSDRLK
jgi:hypothetical protein